MIEQFKEYVQKFDFSDSAIERKYYHSIRVMELCKLIANEIGLNDKDIQLTQVIGLLHDYGRFPQINKYHTFSDLNSIDHGDYGTQILFDNNEITKYWTDKDDYEVIYDAVKYHNKLSIPDELSEHNKTHCQVVRDADKLDILYLFSSKIFVLSENGEISPNVKETFNDKKQINRKDEISGADRVITTLALVYDLNYTCSFKYLKESNYIEKLYETIIDKNKFKYYFDQIIKYIDERVSS